MVYVLIKDKFSGIDTLKILKKSANFCSCNGWYDFYRACFRIYIAHKTVIIWFIYLLSKIKYIYVIFLF